MTSRARRAGASLVQQLMDGSPTTWLDYLTGELKIAAVRDGDLMSLKYDQIESPMAHEIVQECRGLVVCTRRNRVLAWPYGKFWNYGEALAAPVDWTTARVLEKLDGSLMILYWDDGWRVASSGHPTAGGRFAADVRTFCDAFWDLVADLKIDVEAANPDTTYMFELCDTANRVVVRHAAPRLVLHGARDMWTGRELDLDQLGRAADRLGCELVRSFAIASADEAIAAAAALDPLAQEGFVVVDAAGRRVKIKSPRYVALHHLRDNLSPRRAIQLWRAGEVDELLTYFPEFADSIRPVVDAIEEIAARAAADHAAHAALPSRKDYALAVKGRPWAPVCFHMLRDGGGVESARAILRKMLVSGIEDMIRIVGETAGSVVKSGES